MNRKGRFRRTLSHEFAEFIPEQLREGVLYVSTTYATAVHLCCCGCGQEVVTPLSPTDWTLSFNGETVSLSPSIGNWSLPCRSHYWIEDNRIEWSGEMTQKAIDAGRSKDRQLKAAYFDVRRAPGEEQPPPVNATAASSEILDAPDVVTKVGHDGPFAKLLSWLRSFTSNGRG
ncbi:DUF6527 family protein [Variovorax atrisoli]|uniref:DUF6527 family protein n=1 Tax=Variovorax atrisoli TaxID=3394203 RepID=UPI003393671E